MSRVTDYNDGRFRRRKPGRRGPSPVERQLVALAETMTPGREYERPDGPRRTPESGRPAERPSRRQLLRRAARARALGSVRYAGGTA